ncbi:DNA mismatch repair protein MutH [Caloramator sp. E03]|uniref:MutH/Sau3AI family endonuclease n=1 Tax=Caloramator sp. E03 TaxID=2576307 RepID=UPI001110F2DF|nr:MutH/Sau3AI family endonuclease [Caloramator sp. E03]QCX33119.1 DNA mismatch repair protein MutH [Caloramator sp. E03]
MKLIDAKERLHLLVGKEFGQVFSKEQLQDIIRNKGKSGQILELALGLENSSKPLDFEDGELKTNKCDRDGNPKETMFITQIHSIIDELLEQKSFYETHVYKKIANLLYVPICKVGAPEKWMFLSCVHVDLSLDKYKEVRLQLEKDYYTICKQLKIHIETSSDGFIHTSSGELIQIRSKDSKPYHPIYSQKYGKVSNKNHAFYFKREFMKCIVSIN